MPGIPAHIVVVNSLPVPTATPVASGVGAAPSNGDAVESFGVLLANQIKGLVKGQKIAGEKTADAEQNGTAAPDKIPGSPEEAAALALLPVPGMVAVAHASNGVEVAPPSVSVAKPSSEIRALGNISEPTVAQSAEVTAAEVAVRGKNLPAAVPVKVQDEVQGEVPVNVPAEVATTAATKNLAPFHAVGIELQQKITVAPTAQAKADIAIPATPLHQESVPFRPDVAMASAPAQAPAQPIPSVAIEPHVGVPGWDSAFGQKVAWVATQQHQVAELRLNPPSLGPIEVRLVVSDDHANAMFISQHPAVRDAIESAIPRLREMMEASGLTLGNVTVGSHSFTQQQDRSGADGSRTPWFDGVSISGGNIPATTEMTTRSGVRVGMVDTFV
jgi:flagellar hook-length control protein FliK